MYTVKRTVPTRRCIPIMCNAKLRVYLHLKRNTLHVRAIRFGHHRSAFLIIDFEAYSNSENVPKLLNEIDSVTGKALKFPIKVHYDHPFVNYQNASFV